MLGESDGEEAASDDSSKPEEVQITVEEEDNTNVKNILKIVLIVLGAGVLCGGIGAVAVSSKKKKKD